MTFLDAGEYVGASKPCFKQLHYARCSVHDTHIHICHPSKTRRRRNIVQNALRKGIVRIETNELMSVQLSTVHFFPAYTLHIHVLLHVASKLVWKFLSFQLGKNSEQLSIKDAFDWSAFIE